MALLRSQLIYHPRKSKAPNDTSALILLSDIFFGSFYFKPLGFKLIFEILTFDRYSKILHRNPRLFLVSMKGVPCPYRPPFTLEKSFPQTWNLLCENISIRAFEVFGFQSSTEYPKRCRDGDFFPKNFKIRENAHLISWVQVLTSLITNLSFEITADVPLRSCMTVSLKNSSFLFKIPLGGFWSIRILIKAIKLATRTPEGSTSRFLLQTQIAPSTLKMHPRMVLEIRITIINRYLGLLGYQTSIFSKLKTGLENTTWTV